jgi:NAD(P)-dependent dehydrogenase (short-subunit alcohol dehydrogenase family)
MAEWQSVRGKRVLITGATGGIGLAAAQKLAALGADLAVVARDESRARAAVSKIKSAAAATNVDVLHADLSSQRSVRELAADALNRYPRIDSLINNAGAVNRERRLTEDGIELTWAVNHLAPFLLTNLLLERLVASAPARVITTTSDAHKGVLIPLDDINAGRGYPRQGFVRYGQSKLANILFTVELARRLEGSGVTANCVHPGLVATGFNRNNGAFMNLAMTMVRPFSRSPAKGAETIVWLADAPEISGQSGGYFVDKRRATPSGPAQDLEMARRLWELSEHQVGLSASVG